MLFSRNVRQKVLVDNKLGYFVGHAMRAAQQLVVYRQHGDETLSL